MHSARVVAIVLYSFCPTLEPGGTPCLRLVFSYYDFALQSVWIYGPILAGVVLFAVKYVTVTNLGRLSHKYLTGKDTSSETSDCYSVSSMIFPPEELAEMLILIV
jgi:hypothetical protein